MKDKIITSKVIEASEPYEKHGLWWVTYAYSILGSRHETTTAATKKEEVERIKVGDKIEVHLPKQ